MVNNLAIVSKPNGDHSSALPDHCFAYDEIQNRRPTQEDALCWERYDESVLNDLTPVEIGKRLWTTYQNLDQAFLNKDPDDNSGCTASTTIIQHETLIHANLADAAAFAVIYNQFGEICGVKRLNKRTHKPTNQQERSRIEAAGGLVFSERVNGLLAVSRAIGDRNFKPYVCAESDINIYTIESIANSFQINSTNIGKIQVIATCDGFTDAALTESKEGHEHYLKSCLQNINACAFSELQIARALTAKAKADHSTDNISVAVQTIKQSEENTPNFIGMIGVYDGHAGSAAAHFVADQISGEFKKMLHLSDEEYALQKNSAVKKSSIYARDN